jgi:hypothetical protein
MICKEISKHAFIDAFRASLYKDNFSYEGLAALYEYLDEVFTDSKYELDIIGVCSEFSEYTPEDLKYEFSNKGDTLEEVVDALENETTVIKFKGGYIVVQ